MQPDASATRPSGLATEFCVTAHHLELEDAARVRFPPVASLEIGLAPLGREGPDELRCRCRRRVLTEAPHQGGELVAELRAHRFGARALGEVCDREEQFNQQKQRQAYTL